MTHGRLGTFGLATLAGSLLAATGVHTQTPSAERVVIKVDAAKRIGPMKPIWAWFGYDEPNYTYMKDGKKLLTELAALSPVPVFVRTHNLLTTGDGTPGAEVGLDQRLHRGRARPADLRLDDRRSHHRHLPRARMKPLVQIGFMPEALSVKPAALPARLGAGCSRTTDIYTGWAYPPKDYAKWGELVFQWADASGEEVRPRRSRELVLGSLERAGHRLLAGHAGGVLRSSTTTRPTA